MPLDLSSDPASKSTEDRAKLRSVASLGLGLHRGIVRKWPACGKGPLFSGYLSVILVLADRSWQMSVAVEMAIAIPIFAIATLALLPFAKGAVIGFAWARGVVRNPGAAPVDT